MRSFAVGTFQFALSLAAGYGMYSYIQADFSVRIVLAVMASSFVAHVFNKGDTDSTLDAELFNHRDLIDRSSEELFAHNMQIADLQSEIDEIKEQLALLTRQAQEDV
jgi:hypothetical protein